MEITLKLANLTQAEVVACALEFHIDSEQGRKEGDLAEWTKADESNLIAAKAVLKMIRGGK